MDGGKGNPFKGISLILTTFNWPDALEVTLHSILNQSRSPDEILVADDGSEAMTAHAVKRVLGPSTIRWAHVRHGDQGIRQARIKNLAVRYARGSYLLFIDHDVMLHPRFVDDHVHNREKDTFLQGKRSFLPEGFTKRLLMDKKYQAPSPFLQGLGNRKNTIRNPLLKQILSRRKGFQTSIRGCNLSMHRDDFLRVDGYDETFDLLWGREDSDICFRLFHSGVKVKNLWFCALQYHLFHEVIKKKGKDRLDEELEKNLGEGRKKALKGFSMLSSEGGIVASSPGFETERGMVS